MRLILHSKYALDSIAGLQSGALDVAFVRGPLVAEGLESVELLREQLVIVMPSHHPLARRKRIPVESLDDLPCITMPRSLSPALHDAAASLYREAKIRMHAVSSADNLLGHLQLVQEGMGFALLPDSIQGLLPPGVTSRPLACIAGADGIGADRLEERQRVAARKRIRRSRAPLREHSIRCATSDGPDDEVLAGAPARD